MLFANAHTAGKRLKIRKNGEKLKKLKKVKLLLALYTL
jgi:hypothetical protein